MNLTFGVVGVDAQIAFAQAIRTIKDVLHINENLHFEKSADGQAFFGTSQPGGYFPVDKPFFLDSQRRLCILNGYMWYRGHFPLFEEESNRQMSGAAEELCQSGRINLEATGGGVFNFFVYDELKESLFIASDYSGIHPLYYALSGKRLYFSNHIRILSKVLAKDYDPVGIIQRTSFHYTIGKRTLFEGIARLRPGESLRYKVGENSVSVLQPERIYSAIIPYKDDWEAAEAIYAEFSVGVKELARQPGTRGILLSGGYDSRLVAAGFAEQGCPMTAVVIGEETNSEVRLALRVAQDLGIDIRVVNPTQDCQLTPESIEELISGPETVNFTHFHRPGKYLDEMGAVSASTGYGGDTLLGGNGYALIGSQYSGVNRFKLGMSRSLGLPTQFSAGFSTFSKERINQFIASYLDSYLRRSQAWFCPDWFVRNQTNLFQITHADIEDEVVRYLSSSPESALQVFERFWREHQELYTSDILTTLNEFLPLSLPTMHSSFLERCSNLSPSLKVDNGVYQKIIRQYLGKLSRIPTGSTTLSGNLPDILLLLSRTLRGINDRRLTNIQLRTKGQSQKTRYGWTNFESWFRNGSFLQTSPAYIDASIYSKEFLDLKISRWRNWEEKLYSGQELLTLITISQLIR